MRVLIIALISCLISSPIWPIGDNPMQGDPFIIINTNTNQLAFIQGGEVKEVMPVASGKPGDQTPLGTFTVTVKAHTPYYRKKNIPGGHPNNPLGARWIGFDALDTNGRVYGIHGTNRPELIGRAVSAGCIRLRNEAVIKLFDVVPLGTKVHITNGSHSFEEIAKEFGAI
ncbi:L,D-transpeptidase [Alkalihalobacillus oceani]|uniref:L,D-transpeptidase n=1 Tax=Halalkalibacter oceani TaxID=1653776 RepID=UPI00203D96C3|nr:L,D-transpeptidase [Halalkalibacter oceani]MCM3761585.1 L,D-transpeptidase [Halalkalibacter oceani]